MFSKTHSAVLRHAWLIDKAWADAHLPLIARMIAGDKVSFNAGIPTDSEVIGQWRPDFRPCAVHVDASGVVKASRYKSFNEAPAGSIAVIPVNGPITKFLGECGEPGTELMGQWIREADASTNISAIILKVDSPGGMVSGTQSFVDTIAAAVKPVIGFVDDGMAASAAMWMLSACDEAYASQKTDLIGSIGVYTRMADYSGWLEKEGIKIIDIYAPQSTEKNQDYIQALQGNDALIKNELAFIAKEFIGSVKSFRKGKLNVEEGDPFKGAIYNAVEATKIGLIDGIKSFEEVLSIAASKSASNKKSSKKTNSMFRDNFSTLTAQINKETHTEEEIAGINLQLQEKGVNGLVVVSTTQLDSIISENDQLKSNLQAAAEKKNEEETAASQLAAANEKITALEAQVISLEDSPGAKRTGVKKDKDDEPVMGFKANPDAPHNKRAAKATAANVNAE